MRRVARRRLLRRVPRVALDERRLLRRELSRRQAPSRRLAAPAVAALLASELGRDEAWAKSQVLEFTKLAEGYVN